MGQPMKCPLCGKAANSWIYCKARAQDICQDHCKDCQYFAGTMLWSCWYGIKKEAPKEKPKAAEQALPDTRGGRAVEKFRKNMRAIEKRLTHKE